jgi:hypothetical protein
MALLKNNFDFDFYKKIRLGSMVGLFSSADKSNLDLEIKSALIKKYGFNLFFVRVFSVVWSLIKKLMPEGVRWRAERKFPYLW